jgi:hypothetical protein
MDVLPSVDFFVETSFGVVDEDEAEAVDSKNKKIRINNQIKIKLFTSLCLFYTGFFFSFR